VLLRYQIYIYKNNLFVQIMICYIMYIASMSYAVYAQGRY